MNLLTDPWMPVREGGRGPLRQISLEELLCVEGDWQVSLPRDDLELACIQIVTSLAQVLFLPESLAELRERLATPLSPEALADAIGPFRNWFDLDHPEYPFMQTRGVEAAEVTPIQKLLIGLPEGNNHAFFNGTGEVRRLGAACAAIALFNQASNCPSFGGGFKGSLRGGSPVTTLVAADNLRETVWRNVVTRDRVQVLMPVYDYAADRPTWVEPIVAGSTFAAADIGLLRGLFWQPARVELQRGKEYGACELIGGAAAPCYAGFRKAKFNYTIVGLWNHPHGAMTATTKKGTIERKFVSFTTRAPAWTQLSEFVVPRSLVEGAEEGHTPAAPVAQASPLLDGDLHLLVGGYRANQAAVVERRHELISLASGWAEQPDRLEALIDLGKTARAVLRGQLFYAAQGNKDLELKGIGVALHEKGEQLFYARSEGLVHERLRRFSWAEYKAEREQFATELAELCEDIFDRLTEPYAAKPEFIAIIAHARRGLNGKLRDLTEGADGKLIQKRRRAEARP